MSAPQLQATIVEALPDTDGETPGLWCVATENGTRYLILCEAEAQSRAVRVSWYGLHGTWKPYTGSHVHTGQKWPRDRVPVRVGQMMLIRFGYSPEDYYRSGTVVQILRYDLPDALRVEEIQEIAHAAMLDSTADVLVEAYRAGRVPDDQTLAEICKYGGIDYDEVQRRLT